jgi:hypothetical protein
MSKFFIRHSSERYEIVDANWFICTGENWLTFSNKPEAESFLEPFLHEFENIKALQHLLQSIPGSEGFGLSG